MKIIRRVGLYNQAVKKFGIRFFAEVEKATLFNSSIAMIVLNGVAIHIGWAGIPILFVYYRTVNVLLRKM